MLVLPTRKVELWYRSSQSPLRGLKGMKGCKQLVVFQNQPQKSWGFLVKQMISMKSLGDPHFRVIIPKFVTESEDFRIGSFADWQDRMAICCSFDERPSKPYPSCSKRKPQHCGSTSRLLKHRTWESYALYINLHVALPNAIHLCWTACIPCIFFREQLIAIASTVNNKNIPCKATGHLWNQGHHPYLLPYQEPATSAQQSN